MRKTIRISGKIVLVMGERHCDDFISKMLILNVLSYGKCIGTHFFPSNLDKNDFPKQEILLRSFWCACQL